jgi:hypothetical protein
LIALLRTAISDTVLTVLPTEIIDLVGVPAETAAATEKQSD